MRAVVSMLDRSVTPESPPSIYATLVLPSTLETLVPHTTATNIQLRRNPLSPCQALVQTRISTHPTTSLCSRFMLLSLCQFLPCTHHPLLDHSSTWSAPDSNFYFVPVCHISSLLRPYPHSHLPERGSQIAIADAMYPHPPPSLKI